MNQALKKPRVRVLADGSLQHRTPYSRYEAAEPSRFRNFYRNRGSQNEIVQRDAVALRNQARQLVRNHDLARGMLRTLVNNVVGAQGIGVEFQPRKPNGEIHKQYAKDLREAWLDWCRKPEVTHRMSWGQMQRAMARAWIRDGDMFTQDVIGPRPDLDHGTTVPYSLELFEADAAPIEWNRPNERILQGVELNTWGRPVALHVRKTEPWKPAQPYAQDSKRIPWERVKQLATFDHIGQVRGVTEFASVITRLEDIKDYEESERVAAKIAAMLTAYIKKGVPEDYQPPTDADGRPIDGARELAFQPGMVIDDLGIGEDIGLLDSKRPNPNVITFRGGQLRAAAAGFGTSYSATAKDYNGTYSAQRQELVEQWVNYAVLTDEVVCCMIRPIVQTFVRVADLSGVVRTPRGVKPGTADDALYIGQSMPWIDPLKEALGWEALVKAGFASEVEVLRKRGANPWEVLEQIATWREEAEQRGVAFSTNELGMQELLSQTASSE